VLLLAACDAIARQISTLDTPDPAALSCLICNVPLWQGNLPTAIVVMNAYGDDTATPDTFAVCADCFTRHRTTPALASAVLASCSTRIAVPLRALPPMVATPGHA
jgi:hypothetical protein